jgi:hypothetical protein
MFGQSKTIPLMIVSAMLFLPAICAAQTGQCATVVPGNSLPDLIVDPLRLQLDVLVTREKFAADDCAVVEGCVSGKGTHQLLRFTSSTPNIGQGDLVIGDPLQCPNLFHQSECHHHLHFEQYADYRLWTDTGYQKWVASRDLTKPTNAGSNAILLEQARQNGELLEGRKQGFCIIDTDRYDPSAPNTKKYTLCGTDTAAGNQGLQAGWADSYGQQLDCQYIQIDKLQAGIYVLEVQTNAEQLLPEVDYTNNSSIFRFQFVPRHGNTPAQTIPM